MNLIVLRGLLVNPLWCGVCSLLNVRLKLNGLGCSGVPRIEAVSSDSGSIPSLSWQVMLKLRGETPRWDRDVLQHKLRELAEYLSRTMEAEVSVVALVCDSPPNVERTSHGGFGLQRKTGV
jgi:hypothetical protein